MILFTLKSDAGQGESMLCRWALSEMILF